MYFRPPGGIGADVVRVFEARSLFRKPVAGLEPNIAHVEGALEAIALDPLASLSGEGLESLVSAPLTTWTQWTCARCHSIVPHKDWTCPVCGYTRMCRTVIAAVTWRSDAGDGSGALVRLLDVLRVQ